MEGEGGVLLDRRVLSPPYKTVLSVSRSQSLGGGREEEKGVVAGCCSTASSGAKARLSPLKDIAGSENQHKTKDKLNEMTVKSTFLYILYIQINTFL